MISSFCTAMSEVKVDKSRIHHDDSDNWITIFYKHWQSRWIFTTPCIAMYIKQSKSKYDSAVQYARVKHSYKA